MSSLYSVTMLWTVVLITIPILVKGSGEGNIKLLENEVAIALKACAETEKQVNRQKRYTVESQIDDRSRNNQYSHERRNASDMRDQMFVVNATDYDYEGFGAGNEGEKLVNSVPKTVYRGAANANSSYTNMTNNTRNKRSEPLFAKPDTDQCLSQCVFANLQVVDSRGIPREAELWSIVQSSVTSQQSRSALRDQIGACFQELQSEAEDNGCSYSNKLERCLVLRFADRRSQNATETNSNGNKS